MSDTDMIKKGMMHEKNASKLFLQKGSFLSTSPYGFIYEKCSLYAFMEKIFWRDDNRDGSSIVYPFENTLCKEYLDWRDQVNEKGFKNIVYQPDQNFKYNALWIALRYKGTTSDGKKKLRGDRYVVTTGFEQVEKALDPFNESVIASPITYVGKARTAKNARYIYALAFDLDGVGLEQLRDLLYQMHNDVLPTANIIVNSGNGLHLYYVLKNPVALFQDSVVILQKLKRALTKKIWNKFTSEIEKPQYQGIFQGFRVPGSWTKRREKVEAFINHDCPLYSVEDLARRVSNGDEKSIIKQWEWERVDSGKYNTDRLTKTKAKALYPEWYERVIIKGDKSKKKWNVSRDLYDWWLRTLRDPTSDITVGHRYFCLLALSMFAIKCNVPADELKNDLLSLVDPFDRLSDSADNPFTIDDAEDAFEAYKDDFCTFPRNSIEYLTGIRIPKNKRNGRKQAEHLERARAVQDIDYPNKEWINQDGRPKGSIVTAENSTQYALVQEWRKNNPKSSNKSLCARETELSRPTVRKWWNRR